MKLSHRELSTILAALRKWQQDVPQDARDECPIATDDGTCTALDDDDIDELCMNINGAE
ncbi:MAG: hypothetical protein Q7V31_11965 [Parvibaculum sp.]|uniref:hypothetical protein n=1 Tax=Parvibaculum sp. TaxID=2024848 RepID=UPI0027288E3E|nr:hypothetical protein [Parvibaculum sp.]MDO8839634.1 hypothetical protein [Parvibaculum sp.]